MSVKLDQITQDPDEVNPDPNSQGNVSPEVKTSDQSVRGYESGDSSSGGNPSVNDTWHEKSDRSYRIDGGNDRTGLSDIDSTYV